MCRQFARKAATLPNGPVYIQLYAANGRSGHHPARIRWKVWRKENLGGMLILSTTYDIRKPVRNAQRLHQQFPRSHLLLQDAVSHCTTLRSECVPEAIRNFLMSGSGPQSDLFCFQTFRHSLEHQLEVW
jgi:hypothetical protein